ncbi:MAG: aldehyde dehydrogenase family protein [Candidatus Puniceispirillaceae bacterium]
MALPNTTLFYINGAFVPSQDGTDMPVMNPSDDAICATVTLGGPQDGEAAIAAAKAAFASWSQSDKATRVALVERILERYNAHADAMAHAISTEMGAPIDYATSAQVTAGSWHIENFLMAIKDFDFIRPLGDHAPEDRISYEAVGVVGLITPWNWPMNQVTLKVIPAILAGCTMVLKPSEIAPLSSQIFAQIMDEAGTPKGVFNMVHGDGAGIGTLLSGHPDLDMVSFTGSTRAGTAISENAAKTLKRVHLELGGKGANIIFDDADEKAIKRGAIHCFNNAGQSCNAPTRMLVSRARYDEAVATAKSVAEMMQPDKADKSGRHIGPVVSALQYDKIQELIAAGEAEGAKLIAGGTGKPDGLEDGYFVKPTVFADVNNDMTIARTEIFGPVLSILPFDSEEEAIAIANDTPYGLTNYIQSQSQETCQRVAKQLRSGMVEMNGKGRGRMSPFGGMKASGNGREGGIWGIEDFMEIKAISGWEG